MCFVFILCVRSCFCISASERGLWHTGKCPNCPVLSISWRNYSSKFLVALRKCKSMCYVCSLAMIMKQESCETVWFIGPGWRDPRFCQGHFACAVQRAVPRRSCGDVDADAGTMLLRRWAKCQPIFCPCTSNSCFVLSGLSNRAGVTCTNVPKGPGWKPLLDKYPP